MKKLILCFYMLALTVTLGYADNSLWTFDSDIEGWDSPSVTWNTTIIH